eukprot:4960680-Pleurochrysis_carterae.AAC.10
MWYCQACKSVSLKRAQQETSSRDMAEHGNARWGLNAPHVHAAAAAQPTDSRVHLIIRVPHYGCLCRHLSPLPANAFALILLLFIDVDMLDTPVGVFLFEVSSRHAYLESQIHPQEWHMPRESKCANRHGHRHARVRIQILLDFYERTVMHRNMSGPADTQTNRHARQYSKPRATQPARVRPHALMKVRQAARTPARKRARMHAATHAST